jgi:hypothetical protein
MQELVPRKSPAGTWWERASRGWDRQLESRAQLQYPRSSSWDYRANPRRIARSAAQAQAQ